MPGAHQELKWAKSRSSLSTGLFFPTSRWRTVVARAISIRYMYLVLTSALSDADSGSDFVDIMEMLDKRLNDKGKNWRHVLKALKVLDYCLHEGSTKVVSWAQANIYIIKTLREFQYMDEEGRDVGQNGIFYFPPYTVISLHHMLICLALFQSVSPPKS